MVTPVKNQGTCRGCWAFVTTESVDRKCQQKGSSGGDACKDVSSCIS